MYIYMSNTCKNQVCKLPDSVGLNLSSLYDNATDPNQHSDEIHVECTGYLIAAWGVVGQVKPPHFWQKGRIVLSPK